MTKDKARTILENWINKKTSAQTYDGHIDITLPIVDKIIYKENEFNQWSFKGLIKIAYNL